VQLSKVAFSTDGRADFADQQLSQVATIYRTSGNQLEGKVRAAFEGLLFSFIFLRSEPEVLSHIFPLRFFSLKRRLFLVS
jgi:hypothetical protein